MMKQETVKYTLRLPPKLKRRLEKLARERGISQSQYLCSLIAGKPSEAMPPTAFWNAMHELYQIHDMLLREGKAEDARQLELSIVALQSAFTLESEQEVP